MCRSRRLRLGGHLASEKDRISCTLRLRLEAFAASWFRTWVAKLTSSTAARYAFELHTHIVPAFGDYYIDAITKDDLKAWRDAQRTKPASINSVLRTLKLVVRACSRNSD